MKIDRIKLIKRGFAKKCPNCGKFPIFLSYIKTHTKCKNCGIKFSEYRS